MSTTFFVCCQLICIVHFWLPHRCSLTFIMEFYSLWKLCQPLETIDLSYVMGEVIIIKGVHKTKKKKTIIRWDMWQTIVMKMRNTRFLSWTSVSDGNIWFFVRKLQFTIGKPNISRNARYRVRKTCHFMWKMCIEVCSKDSWMWL